MVSTRRVDWLGLFSGLSLLGAIVLILAELILYSRTFTSLPPGLSLGGVPVGGLTETQAIEQLTTALQQRYAYHTVKEKLDQQGFSLVEEEVKQDQTIHLVLRRTV